MTQCYRHLQYDERCQIRALHKQGVSISEIARQLGRHKSTVSRELRRNAGKAGYRHKQAQRKAEQRRRLASSGPRKLTAAVWNIARTLLLLTGAPSRLPAG
jgi:IS30 family transposase